MPDDKTKRFPGYDVLSKRLSPSWNNKTREVINRRLALPHTPNFFSEAEFSMVLAIVDRLVPQPKDRPPIPVSALVDHRLHSGQSDGYRASGMPRDREAWQIGLSALDAEAQAQGGKPFVQLSAAEQDQLLKKMQEGELDGPAWKGMPAKTFFKQCMAHDVVFAYYAHPTAWSEIGWGGPASPRGYVRMGLNERDPWEAAEVKDGDTETARRKNRNVD
jgi:hypothetical protein